MPNWFGWLTLSNQTVGGSADSWYPRPYEDKRHLHDFQSAPPTIRTSRSHALPSAFSAS
jgi:hypothetical protein